MSTSAPTIPKAAKLEPWLTAADARAYLAISPATLNRWVSSGKLNPKRTPSGAYRFRKGQLDAVLD